MDRVARLRWVKWSLFVLTVFAIINAFIQNLQHQEDSRVGSIAPSFELTDLQGETVRLADFRGSNVLLNFWASWCGPCVNEMPLLNEVYAQSSDIAIIAVNVGETPERARRFVEKVDLDFTVVLDRDNEMKKKYRINGLPVTLLIDKNGRIVERRTGELRSNEQIEALLDKFRHP
ncbi:thiol-disulfide oxidoreductase [Paenibacillus oralis]|uniref:Thiol-disulfide oxidoreductase n=1 Tax=Paenibacillus oralis TaxID=2490856 RepID=A0A3P3UAA4_9BACL|nr:redoxin domain-containing protein [Paenibacillus oralis]RRJ67287.1 thiol-disulfide oxidoreductase [Paenibacillus oralis]